MENKINEMLNSKNVVIDHYSYTDDGVLYLTINEYSLYPRVYYDNKEKYQNDYYLVDQYCFRINEKKQQVERLNFPKVNAKDYYNVNKLDNAQYVKKDQLLPNIITVLKMVVFLLALMMRRKADFMMQKHAKRLRGN